MMNAQQAAAWLKEHSAEQITVSEMDARLHALGYRRDRSSRCVGTARLIDYGLTYQCVTYNAQEADTGMSFAHFQARRDANFKALQDMRRRVFAVHAGLIVEL